MKTDTSINGKEKKNPGEGGYHLNLNL